MNVSRPPAPIPGLFERQSINLIIGTSGAGKTQFLFNQLEIYATGGGFLDHASVGSPVQMGLIVCSRSANDVIHTLQKFPFLGSGRLNFPYHMWKPAPDQNDYFNLEFAYNDLNDEGRAPVRLLIVENFQLLMNDGKILDTQLVKKFLSAVQKFCQDKDVTIIGTVGTPKMKSTECYPQLADRIPGANCWASEVNTLIGVERTKLHKQPESRPSLRRIIVQTQEAADTVHWGQFLEDGRLDVSPDYVPVEEEAVSAGEKLLNEKLTRMKPGEEFTKKDLQRLIAEKKLSMSTLERWVSQQLKDGTLVRTGKTNRVHYHKPLEQ